MTQEEKDIILHGAAFEMMNACINFEDGTVDREKMLKAMHRYAEMYHSNELSKLNLGVVSGSFCECAFRSLAKPISDNEYECFDCGKEIKQNNH